jgi:hypothetical protein
MSAETKPEEKQLPPPLQILLEKLEAVETRWRSEPSPDVRAEHYAEDIGVCMAGLELQSRTVERYGARILELEKALAFANTVVNSGLETAPVHSRPRIVRR